MNNQRKRKILIVGNGAVGSTYAYALTLLGISKEIGIIDIDEKKCIGDAIDLSDALAYCSQKKIYHANYQDCKDADIIVITAGAPQKPGETRLDLMHKNLNILKEILVKIMLNGFKGIFIIASNPVDILTYATLKFTKFPKNKVIGSGTVLDTARLRKEIGMELNVDMHNVHAYILGEHGDSEFSVWSNTDIGVIPIKTWLYQCGKNHDDIEFLLNKTEAKVKNTAYEIIDMKGATFYGIATSLANITKAILDDENKILTVSSLLEGEFGIHDVCLSAPSIINKDGIRQVMEFNLNDEEREKIHKSEHILKKMINECKL